ncbi:MAG: hypothetical protein DYG83_00105 [Candidatus Brocadia sp. AMX2]|uniref:Uncharacterized conserved protein n=1 Tax=Candidatus Brocadia sinica JPN1 TaxID=1197129 RepID=A0ABQ0JWB6_9BACT|nr:MAG: hypothetical protein EDM70_02635 [Candidatus Brocadia sp. AMX2]MBC6931756.1 hypothetical protein [Candidatus Brocadia sp.]MBL1167388.1 hypothetical protein [Candidatus Brocadia sp. AMX1]GAN33037.1 uncharacterized conserved protein [Candidatus Brocadia sinica JPN1]MCE7865230.1 hypothetical protein [Candidatus Brocadia sp. AMX2]
MPVYRKKLVFFRYFCSIKKIKGERQFPVAGSGTGSNKFIANHSVLQNSEVSIRKYSIGGTGNVILEMTKGGNQ